MNPDRSSTDSVLLQVSLWRWLGVVLSPFLLTVVILTVVFTATGGSSPVPRLPTGVYSLLSVFVVALLVQRLSLTARTEILPTRTPRRTETAVAVVVALVTILVFDPVATYVTSVLGSSNGTTDSFDSPLGTAIFVVSSVVVAPVVEEYLFRGVALDVFRSRYGVAVAVVGSCALFGAIHFLIGNVSALVSATLSGLAYAGMRIQFENLTGAIIAHGINNLYWVLVMADIIPNVVPG